MKNTFLFLAALVSLQVSAQTFKMTDARRADFEVCQANHNIILDKFIRQTESQAARMITGIAIETRNYTPSFKLNSYKSVLTDVIIKRIVYGALKKQLNRESLKAYFAKQSNYHKPFLNEQSITVDLSLQVPGALKHIKNTNNLKVSQDMINGLKNGILKDAAVSLVSKRYRQIGAGIFTRIVTGQAGKVATSQVLKSATMSLGSKLFISASKGLLIDLITMPLHGYRLPPETLWTDLLEEYPELIIVPEWMKRGGVDDHAWSAHCNAIQRRTKLMEERLSRVLKIEEREFIKRVSYINEYIEESPAKKPSIPSYYSPVAVDNTYVKKPIIIPGSLAPFWARLK